MRENGPVDALNQPFHEAYHEEFPTYARKIKTWGASPVQQAMTDLRRLADAGIITSGRIPLGANWQPGFPRSVKTYWLPVT